MEGRQKIKPELIPLCYHVSDGHMYDTAVSFIPNVEVNNYLFTYVIVNYVVRK